MTAAPPKTLFTGKCHDCGDVVLRGLYCAKCVVVEALSNELLIFSRGSHQVELLERLWKYQGWPEILDFVARMAQEKPQTDLSQLAALACRVRELCNGIFGKRLPTGAENSEQRRAIADECHRPAWKRALARAFEVAREKRDAANDLDAYMREATAILRGEQQTQTPTTP